MAESSYQLRAHRQLHKPRFLRWWDKKQGWYQTVSSGSPSAEGKGSRWVGSERGSTDRQTLRASMSFSLAPSTAATGEAGRAAEVGQVQLGLTSTRRYGEYANLHLCSKRFEFSFKDMQMVYLKSPSLSFFLSTFRAEKYSFKFLLLFETEWGNSTQNTLIWKQVTDCGEMKGN